MTPRVTHRKCLDCGRAPKWSPDGWAFALCGDCIRKALSQAFGR